MDENLGRTLSWISEATKKWEFFLIRRRTNHFKSQYQIKMIQLWADNEEWDGWLYSISTCIQPSSISKYFNFFFKVVFQISLKSFCFRKIFLQLYLNESPNFLHVLSLATKAKYFVGSLTRFFRRMLLYFLLSFALFWSWKSSCRQQIRFIVLLLFSTLSEVF